MSGLLAEVREYCDEWKLPDVTKISIRKDDLSREAKKMSSRKLWKSLVKRRKVGLGEDVK